jgi:hypothetical protein
MIVAGLDLGQLSLHGRVIRRKTADSAKRASSLLWLIFLDKKPRCFGKNQHAKEQDKRPSELDGNRNAIGPRIISHTCSIINDRSQ